MEGVAPDEWDEFGALIEERPGRFSKFGFVWNPEDPIVGRAISMVVGFGVIGLLLHAWSRAPWFLLLGAYVLGVVVHELGHLAVAGAARDDVREISIGQGRVLLRRMLGSLAVEVRALPFSGHVVTYPREGRWRTYRRSLVLVGGVAANVSLAGCSLAFLPDWLARPLVTMNLFCFVAALFPSSDEDMPSDGQQLWRLLTGSEPTGLEPSPETMMVFELYDSGFPEAAVRFADRFLARNPDDLGVQRLRARGLYKLHRYAETRQALDSLLAARLKIGVRAELLSILALCDVALGHTDLDEADSASREALQLDPTAPLPCLSRALVLVITGHPDEGLELAHSLHDDDPINSPERARTAGAVAVALEALGRLEEAEPYRAAAVGGLEAGDFLRRWLVSGTPAPPLPRDPLRRAASR